jgi:predicted ferric reductase
VAFYLSAFVTGSFYIRKQIGQRAWRLIHFASFAVYLLALLHGITSGTDSGTILATLIYWSTGGSLLFLLFYRILAAAASKQGVHSKA